MIQLICFFSPAFLAVLLLEKNLGRPLTNKDFIMSYLMFVGTINFLCMIIVAVVFHHPDRAIVPSLFTIGFTAKYLLLSFFIAGVLPMIFIKVRNQVKRMLQKF